MGLGRQEAPRGLQDGPRGPQEAAKTPPSGPKVPTWVQVGFQNGAKIEEKSMEKSIENVMHLGIDFWDDVGGFLEENRRKIDESQGGAFNAVPPFKAGQSPVLSWPPESGPLGLSWPLKSSKILYST